MIYSDKYLAFMGHAPQRIPHWEHWSCPDAETYLTGINYYEHPRECRLRLQALYPQLELPIPETDAPKPKPRLDLEAKAHWWTARAAIVCGGAMVRPICGIMGRRSTAQKTSSPSRRSRTVTFGIGR